MSSDAGPAFLARLTVLEFGDDVAVRYCGRLLAAGGATVLRRPAAGDERRGHGGGDGVAYGQWLDQGKRIVGAMPAGAAPQLVLGGLDDAAAGEAAAAAAGLDRPPVLLAMRWLPATGPLARWQATDETIAALTGLCHAFGAADGPPMLAQGHIPQVVAGVVGFNAAVAACLERRRPRLRRLDVNVFEAALCFSENGALGALADGTAARRLGVNRFQPTYPCAAFRCLDGWVGITCLTPAQWRALCHLADQPALADDARFATAVQRLAIADEVDRALAPAIARRTGDEWVRLGMAHRIPIAPMPAPADLPRQPHWRERGAFAPLSDAPGAPLAPTLPHRTTCTGPAAAWTAADGGSPLHGLRVVDFSMGWAGPLCTRTLADLGADVVKVESDAHPDWWRGWETGPEAEAQRETKVGFLNMNRGKRGVAIDLTRPEGLAQARALVRGADVVIENFAAGVMEKLGLGADVRRRLRPGLIAVTMPAFGQGGPWSGIRAYGSTVEQASGLPYLNGEPDWPPALQHVALGDPVAGLYAAAAILGALHGREAHGGADIDLAQVACLFQLGADGLLAAQRHGGGPPRTGHARARAALSRVVRCEGEDRWLAVTARDAAELRALDAVVAGPADRCLAAWAAHRPADEAARRLQEAGLCAAPVKRADELGRDAQLLHGGYWQHLERAYVGRHGVSAAPWLADGQRVMAPRPAPTLGEHGGEILAPPAP